MWVPEQFDSALNSTWGPSLADAHHIPQGPSLFSHLREWSSIIGIVTAIVGNILISFALNVQRYAHIRINQEYSGEEVSPPQRKGRSSTRPSPNRTPTEDQLRIVTERARLNAEAPGPGDGKSDTQNGGRRSNGWGEHESSERSPLLKRHASESTITSVEKRSEHGETRKSYLKSPYWWVGIVLMTVGEAGNFLAYGFAPASIVSTLGVFALVSNCIIAPFMNKERFRYRDGVGVLIAIGGAVTVVLSAKSKETKMGPDELWGAILRWEFLTYLGISATLITILMFASPRYGDSSILIDLGVVGLFGGYTALSTKGVASMLSDTLWRALTFPITYLLVLILISSAFMQIRYVNRSLQRFASTQVIPTQFVLFTLSVIIGSAVLYRDFESTTTSQAGEFIGGCLLTFFGVYLLTSGRSEEHDYTTSDYYNQEEGIHMFDEEAAEAEPRSSRRNTTTSNSYAQSQLQSPPATPPGPSGQNSPSSPHTPITYPSIHPSPSPWSSSPSSHPHPPVSPFTRAQSNLTVSTISSPTSPTIPRLRPTQSDQHPHPNLLPNTSASPSATLLRSPSTPNPLNHQQTPIAATAALRAHLTPLNSPTPPNQHTTPLSSTTGTASSTLNRAARGSFSRLIPGPLISPLSSGLSAVVADSLRKGQGSLRGKKRALFLRRGRSVLTTTGIGAELEAGDGAESASESATEGGGEGVPGPRRGTLRAVSESLGGLVGRRKRSRESRGPAGEGRGKGVLGGNIRD